MIGAKKKRKNSAPPPTGRRFRLSLALRFLSLVSVFCLLRSLTSLHQPATDRAYRLQYNSGQNLWDKFVTFSVVPGALAGFWFLGSLTAGVGLAMAGSNVAFAALYPECVLVLLSSPCNVCELAHSLTPSSCQLYPGEKGARTNFATPKRMNSIASRLIAVHH